MSSRIFLTLTFALFQSEAFAQAAPLQNPLIEAGRTKRVYKVTEGSHASCMPNIQLVSRCRSDEDCSVQELKLTPYDPNYVIPAGCPTCAHATDLYTRDRIPETSYFNMFPTDSSGENKRFELYCTGGGGGGGGGGWSYSIWDFLPSIPTPCNAAYARQRHTSSSIEISLPHDEQKITFNKTSGALSYQIGDDRVCHFEPDLVLQSDIDQAAAQAANVSGVDRGAERVVPSNGSQGAPSNGAGTR